MKKTTKENPNPHNIQNYVDAIKQKVNQYRYNDKNIERKEDCTHEGSKNKSSCAHPCSSDSKLEKMYKMVTKEIQKDSERRVPQYALPSKKYEKGGESNEGDKKRCQRKNLSKSPRSCRIQNENFEDKFSEICVITQVHGEHEVDECEEIVMDHKTDKYLHKEIPYMEYVRERDKDQGSSQYCSKEKKMSAKNPKDSQYTRSWSERYMNLKKVFEPSLGGLKHEEDSKVKDDSKETIALFLSNPPCSGEISQPSTSVFCLSSLRHNKSKKLKSPAVRKTSKSKHPTIKSHSCDIRTQSKQKDSKTSMDHGKKRSSSQQCNINNFFIINCESQRIPELLSALNKNIDNKHNVAKVETLLRDKVCKFEKQTQVRNVKCSFELPKVSKLKQLPEGSDIECKRDLPTLEQFQKVTQASQREGESNRQTQTTPLKKNIYKSTQRRGCEDKPVEPWLCGMENGVEVAKDTSCRKKYNHKYKSENMVKKSQDTKHLSNESKKAHIEIRNAANYPTSEEKELYERNYDDVHVDKFVRQNKAQIDNILRKYSERSRNPHKYV